MSAHRRLWRLGGLDRASRVRIRTLDRALPHNAPTALRPVVAAWPTGDGTPPRESPPAGRAGTSTGARPGRPGGTEPATHPGSASPDGPGIPEVAAAGARRRGRSSRASTLPGLTSARPCRPAHSRRGSPPGRPQGRAAGAEGGPEAMRLKMDLRLTCRPPGVVKLRCPSPASSRCNNRSHSFASTHRARFRRVAPHSLLPTPSGGPVPAVLSPGRTAPLRFGGTRRRVAPVGATGYSAWRTRAGSRRAAGRACAETAPTARASAPSPTTRKTTGEMSMRVAKRDSHWSIAR